MNLINKTIEGIMQGDIPSILIVMIALGIMIVSLIVVVVGQISAKTFVILQSLGLIILFSVVVYKHYAWKEVDDFHIPYENYVLELNDDIKYI